MSTHLAWIFAGIFAALGFAQWGKMIESGVHEDAARSLAIVESIEDKRGDGDN